MSSPNRPARLNRTLLLLAGLICVLGGGFGLATNQRRLHLVRPGSRIVPGAANPPTWALYVTAVVAVVVGLLALRWLLAQLVRKPAMPTWRLATGTGTTTLAAGTASQPFTADIAGYPGVQAVRGAVTGTRENPTAQLVITTSADADLAGITERIDTHAMPRLRQALDAERVQARIEYRTTAQTRVR